LYRLNGQSEQRRQSGLLCCWEAGCRLQL
jgi:hypothetical protein